MVLNIAARRPHDLGVRRAAAAVRRYKALVNALRHQNAADLGEKLVVEPAHQPADLDPLRRFARHHPGLGAGGRSCLVEVFGDDRGSRYWRHAFFHQDRRGSRGIKPEEFLAPLPRALFDQARRRAKLLEDQPHEAGMRAGEMMKQCQHTVGHEQFEWAELRAAWRAASRRFLICKAIPPATTATRLAP